MPLEIGHGVRWGLCHTSEYVGFPLESRLVEDLMKWTLCTSRDDHSASDPPGHGNRAAAARLDDCVTLHPSQGVCRHAILARRDARPRPARDPGDASALARRLR